MFCLLLNMPKLNEITVNDWGIHLFRMENKISFTQKGHFTIFTKCSYTSNKTVGRKKKILNEQT